MKNTVRAVLRKEELRQAYPMLSEIELQALAKHERNGTIPPEAIRKKVMGKNYVPIDRHAEIFGYTHVVSKEPEN